MTCTLPHLSGVTLHDLYPVFGHTELERVVRHCRPEHITHHQAELRARGRPHTEHHSVLLGDWQPVVSVVQGVLRLYEHLVPCFKW